MGKKQMDLNLGERRKFYTFSQNNSGGSFIVDDNVGYLVIIEATSVGNAIERAEAVGLYFDGDGDCPCCGNRWSSWMDDSDGTDEPSHYGKPITPESVSGKDGLGSYFCDSVRIHYMDGRVVRYDRDPSDKRRRR